VVLTVFAIVLVFSLLLGGSLYLRCGFRCDAHGLPVGFVTEQNLKSHPEAWLYYPNSKVLETHVYPEATSDTDGAGEASIQTFLEAIGKVGESDAESQAVFSWYSAYLTAHGWHAVGQARYQTFVRGHRERFEVNFSTNVSVDGWLQYSTAYRIEGCRLVNTQHPDVAC
jgi:hypothetical protein